jgi:hypothetical protein
VDNPQPKANRIQKGTDRNSVSAFFQYSRKKEASAADFAADAMKVILLYRRVIPAFSQVSAVC